MTHREVFAGTDKFISRRCLKENELRVLLKKKYTDKTIDELITSVKLCDVWTDCDNHISVVYTYRPQDSICPDRFVIITTGKNYDLLGIS